MHDSTHTLVGTLAGTLDHETREYMHINDYGKPLPTWMEFKKQKKTTR